MVLRPASTPEVSVDGVLWADGLTLHRAWTYISAFPLILIGHNKVVLNRVQNLGPVQGGQVAEVWILLNSHSSPGDIHQTVQAELLQMQHLINHKSIVEEEVVATDHSQVGEQITEGLQAVNSEQQHVICHHSQLWEAEASEVLGLGLEHEQNLQVSLDDGAVFQRLKLGHIVPNVLI